MRRAACSRASDEAHCYHLDSENEIGGVEWQVRGTGAVRRVTRLVHLFQWFQAVNRNRPVLNHWGIRWC